MFVPSFRAAILVVALLWSPASALAAPKSTSKKPPAAAPTPAPEPVATPEPESAAKPFFGLSESTSVSGRLTYDEAANLQARVGATSTRMSIHWSWVERSPDVYSWGIFDGVYWASIRAGLKPVIVFTGAPRWAQDHDPNCTQCNVPPSRAHDADWQDVLRRLATRYPEAAAIEIWNEPNLTWAWRSGPDPQRYTELLKLGYDAVKSVRPEMPVLGGSLAPVLTEATSGDGYGVRPFLQSMYDNGARGRMDGLAMHPYPYSLNFGLTFKTVGLAKEVRTRNGDSVPVWLTELGVSTSAGFTYDEQGIAVPRLVEAYRADPEVRGIFVHTLLDDATAALTSRGYGLMDAELTPKPAYCALAVANAATWRCPDTITPAAPNPTQSRYWDAQVLLQAAADAARRVHEAKGAYATVTAADLNAVDPRIRPTSPAGDAFPGEAADPSSIGVWPATDGRDGLLLCNASRADRSYCIHTFWGGNRNYGSFAGSMYAAASVTTKQTVRDW